LAKDGTFGEVLDSFHRDMHKNCHSKQGLE